MCCVLLAVDYVLLSWLLSCVFVDLLVGRWMLVVGRFPVVGDWSLVAG